MIRSLVSQHGDRSALHRLTALRAFENGFHQKLGVDVEIVIFFTNNERSDMRLLKASLWFPGDIDLIELYVDTGLVKSKMII